MKFTASEQAHCKPPVTKAVTSTLFGISFALFEQIDSSNHNKHKHKQNHPISLSYCSAMEWH